MARPSSPTQQCVPARRRPQFRLGPNTTCQSTSPVPCDSGDPSPNQACWDRSFRRCHGPAVGRKARRDGARKPPRRNLPNSDLSIHWASTTLDPRPQAACPGTLPCPLSSTMLQVSCMQSPAVAQCRATTCPPPCIDTYIHSTHAPPPAEYLPLPSCNSCDCTYPRIPVRPFAQSKRRPSSLGICWQDETQWGTTTPTKHMAFPRPLAILYHIFAKRHLISPKHVIDLSTGKEHLSGIHSSYVTWIVRDPPEPSPEQPTQRPLPRCHDHKTPGNAMQVQTNTVFARTHSRPFLVH